jgi:hypothetical protein
MLLDDQRRVAVGAQLPDPDLDLLHEARRKAFRGLVHQDQVRVRHERAADREHLLLAAAEVAAQARPVLKNLKGKSLTKILYYLSKNNPSRSRGVLLKGKRRRKS